MLTDVFRLWGQLSIGPSGVRDQSRSRINWLISPPPVSQSFPAGVGPTSSAFTADRCFLGLGSIPEARAILSSVGIKSRARSGLEIYAAAPTSSDCRRAISVAF